MSAVGNPGVYVRERSSIWKTRMDAAEKSRCTPVMPCDEVRPSAQRTSQSEAGRNSIGALLVGLSVLGLPVTVVVVRWMGSLGRVCTLIGYGVLFTRACFMIRGGAPLRMKPLTARLLYAELVADAIGCGACLWAWVVWRFGLGFRPELMRQHEGATHQTRVGSVGWHWPQPDRSMYSTRFACSFTSVLVAACAALSPSIQVQPPRPTCTRNTQRRAPRTSPCAFTLIT